MGILGVVAILVLGVVFLMITIINAFVLMFASSKKYKTKRGLIKWYIYHAQKLTQVKIGEENLWGWGFKTDRSGYLSLKVMGFVWVLLPIVALIGIGLLLKLLFGSLIGWIVIGSIVGFIVIIKFLNKVFSKILRGIASLDTVDNKVSKVYRGLKRLANKE